MEPNQLKKIVIPAAAAAAIILLIGCLFLIGNAGTESDGTKPTLADSGLDDMSQTIPPADSPEFKDIGNGLKVWDVKVGTGAECKPGATVTIHYTGWLLDGTEFDTTRKGRCTPATYALSGLIRGWQKGIPGMKQFGIRRLLIPPSLAYGAGGRTGIPGNSTLLFEIKLLDSHEGPS
ncbi:MAG TPA: FKBP-type peptidyl-prolyl cis-trans isomerase [Fimbriiglobus sp.]|jgi:FKBP-type peptidyl-prolyl cis-trans isomerase